MNDTWNESNSFQESELKRMAQLGEVRSLVVKETLEGYIALIEARLMILNPTTGKHERSVQTVTWRTRRTCEPRVFSSLERLMDKLGEVFPAVSTVRIEMLPYRQREARRQVLEDLDRKPGRPSDKLKATVVKTVEKATKKAKTAKQN